MCLVVNKSKYSQFTNSEQGEIMNLKEPVTLEKSKLYGAVLIDADGNRYFWKRDGSYDGYCKECNNIKKETK